MKTSSFCSVTPTVDTSAYAAKDCIGGLLTFNPALPANRMSGRVTAVMVADKSDNSVEYDLVLFRSLPAGTFTDQAAFDPSDADLAKMLPVINLGTSDHFSFNDNGISSVSSLDSVAFSLTQDATTGLPILYGALVSRGTPTYASASDVTITLVVTSD